MWGNVGASGGAAMLGLGDIVMPGLLLSFAARFDYTAYLGLKSGYTVFLWVLRLWWARLNVMSTIFSANTLLSRSLVTASG
jgi:presenilin-like A22 family membrane protease